MNVVLVARDIAGCNGLRALGEELANRGHSVTSHFAMGKPIALPNQRHRPASE